MSEKSSDMFTLGFAMKNLKKKAAALGAVAAISLGLVATTVAPAQAFSTIEMHQACRLADYGHDQGSILWSAQLTYPDHRVSTGGAATSTTPLGRRGTIRSTR